MVDRNFRFPNPKQRRFVKSNADIVLYSGAVGAGKSFGGCSKALLKNLKNPNNRGLIVRKERKALVNSTLVTLLEGGGDVDPVLPEEMIVNHQKQENRIEHKTGQVDENGEPVTSEIWYLGLDQGADDDYPSKIGSTEFGWIFVDEMAEISENDFDFLQSRLRLGVGKEQIFGATNPDAPTHWIKQRLIDGDDERDEDVEVIHATLRDNPHLSESYKNRLLNSYTGMMYDRLIEGKWVAAEGLVYEDFKRDTHVKPTGWFKEWNEDKQQLEYLDYEQVIVGADAGVRNPRVFLVIGVTGNGEYHVLNEFYRSDTQVDDAVEWLQDWQASTGLEVWEMYHDPSEPSDIERIENAGINCMDTDNDITGGIQAVSRKLADDTGDGVELYVSNSCSNLINEFYSYQYPKSNSGSADEKPVKENDHAMDALRYALFNHGKGGLYFTAAGNG